MSIFKNIVSVTLIMYGVAFYITAMILLVTNITLDMRLIIAMIMFALTIVIGIILDYYWKLT